MYWFSDMLFYVLLRSVLCYGSEDRSFRARMFPNSFERRVGCHEKIQCLVFFVFVCVCVCVFFFLL